MSRISDIKTILYYVLKKPEKILEIIQGQIVSPDELGGGNSEILGAKSIRNPQHLYIGKGSYIGGGASIWIHDTEFPHGEFGPAYEGKKMAGCVNIGSDVRIGGNISIDCYEKVEIEDDCLLANDIFIADGCHGTSVEGKSYVETEGKTNPIRIGKGSWIGARVSILSGANIGERCIIGTNAVVTGSSPIPDYSIAVGIPARVIKRYNKETQQWENA